MAGNEKIQLLLDMQEHPENYPEQALTSMMEDPEARELMEATALLKQAMNWEATTDAAAGWRQAASPRLSGGSPQRRWQMAAALFIGVLLVSGIAFAAIHIAGGGSSRGELSGGDGRAMPDQPSATMPADTAGTDTIAPRVIRYDEAQLQKILTEMAGFYRLRLAWKDEDAKAMRLFYQWDQHQEPKEAIRRLNMFERIHLELSDSTITVERP